MPVMVARPSAVVRLELWDVAVIEFCEGAEFSVILTAAFETVVVIPLIVFSRACNSANVDTSPVAVPKVMTWLAPPFTATVSVVPAEPILSSRLVEL